MKRNTVIKSAVAISVLSALILVGGCKSMDKDDVAVCPSCHKTAHTFHPHKGMTVKTVNCTSCKQAVKINDAGEVTGTVHYCDTCGALVGECPKCAAK